METNILGLPSFTGFTPLKAIMKGQVLKYDFRGVGPRVIDKSGHGNGGRLMPKEDPPRRKIVSWFPLEVILQFDGKDDFILVSDDPSLNVTDELKIEAVVNPDWTGKKQTIVFKTDWDNGYQLVNRQDMGWTDFFVRNAGSYHMLRYRSDLPTDEESKIVCRFTEDEISMEINGEVVMTETPKIDRIGASTRPLGIGARDTGGVLFKGYMKRLSISGE